jgi:hypothetical protein
VPVEEFEPPTAPAVSAWACEAAKVTPVAATIIMVKRKAERRFV